MADYACRLSPKIGDVLYGKANLDLICGRYDVVHVATHRGMYIWRSDGETVGDYDAYHEFMSKLYAWLFSEKNYRVDMGHTIHLHTDWPNICREHGVDAVKPDLRSYLKPEMKGSGEFPEDYLVVMTKVVHFDIDNFERDGKPLWDALRAQADKRKIIVMGEQVVEPCYEKRLHKAGYFSMYPQIVRELPAESIIDMTVPALGITTTTFERFQTDCWIASCAKACVTFGFGGAFCMATSFGRSVCYLNRASAPTDAIFKNGFVGDCLATQDMDLCVETLRSL